MVAGHPAGSTSYNGGMFNLVGISKHYGQVRAVGPLDLRIEPGRSTVLLGPSGCGKSTLLRLMTGLAFPDAGEVRFDGRVVQSEQWQSLRRELGYVIQEGGLFPHLTARSNVTLMAQFLGWTSPRIDGRLEELGCLTRLKPNVLSRYPGELSGGQRQRVSLMRALMLDPAVLLLDEPLGALDPMTRFDLQNDLADIFRSLKKTVVLVTHDLAEAGFLGDEIVLLREGQIVQTGSLAQLVNHPAETFVSSFVNAQRSPLEAVALIA